MEPSEAVEGDSQAASSPSERDVLEEGSAKVEQGPEGHSSSAPQDAPESQQDEAAELQGAVQSGGDGEVPPRAAGESDVLVGEEWDPQAPVWGALSAALADPSRAISVSVLCRTLLAKK